jgi:CO/xanthine dehydrogenase FAD-binding subunit
MRGDAEAHELVAPGSLAAALELMAEAPGQWTPIAGGTELMVAHAAGRLPASKLISLWDIPDLRFIHCTPDTLAIGAGATFTDMRTNAAIPSDFPLLARAAAWIGSIANQNRATLGGNLVNGSPAADSSPALLVYDADLELVSVRGHRRIAYSAFHSGYKKNVLGPGELVLAIHLRRRFKDHRQYIRKVGTRRAMAVAKVALAGTAMLEGAIVREIRLAAASLAAFPARLYRTEDAICGKRLDAESIGAARAALLAEVLPIDDIRSTAEYRRGVAANLLGEFLNTLRAPDRRP